MPAPPKDSPKDDEAFLSRWSRRKRTDVEVMEEAPEESPAAEVPAEELTDEKLLAELDLPEPDMMKAGDDFSAFMQARVPERLRRRALRNLWLSNPALANLDELVDYGEDFTDAATVIENMQTVYEVGKGAAEKWKAHLATLAEEAEAAEPTEAKPDTEPEPVNTQEPETVVAQAEPAPMPVLGTPENDSAPIPTPRHMRFAFE